MELPEPSLVLQESLPGEPPQIALVCEGMVIVRDIAGIEAPLILSATYYALNIKEPKGLSSFLKYLFSDLLNIELTKKPKIVSHVGSLLD